MYQLLNSFYWCKFYTKFLIDLKELIQLCIICTGIKSIISGLQLWFIITMANSMAEQNIGVDVVNPVNTDSSLLQVSLFSLYLVGVNTLTGEGGGNFNQKGYLTQSILSGNKMIF